MSKKRTDTNSTSMEDMPVDKEKEIDSSHNSDGMGIADAALTGVGVDDARKAETERKEKPEKSRKGFTADLLSSLVNGISNVPDGLATAMMVGVNPVHGLYSSIVAPTLGSAVSSSQLMIIANTVAAAVFAGQALSGVPEEQKLTTLFTFVVMAGIALMIFGFLKFGRLMKYISYPVMRGFMYGVGLLLILGESSGLVGYTPEGSNTITEFIDMILNVGNWNWSAVLVSVITLGVMLILRKTPAKLFASILALVAGTLVASIFNLDSVQIVQDISTIPRGLPEFTLPNLSIITPQLVFSSITLAAVTAVQGVGVSQMAENPDGTPVDPSRDMVAQGVANIGSGLFSGIPVGASIGSTALNMTLGATSRLAGVLAGAWMLAIILIFPSLVEQIPMPALASLIMVAGFGAVNVKDSFSILRSGWSAVLGFVVTMLSVLLFSIPVAVTIGVVLSILFYFVSSASDVVVEHHVRKGDKIGVKDAPEMLASNEATVLGVDGSLFFAGAQTFKEKLPRVGDAENPVVILRLRNQSQMGATLIDILDDYADDLKENGGKLYLAGLDDDQFNYLHSSGKVKLGEEVEIFKETEVIGESTEIAFANAVEWLKDRETHRMKE